LWLNLAINFCHVCRYAETADLLDDARPRAIELGDTIDLSRITWLTGRIEAGQGRPREARVLLEQARRDFTASPGLRSQRYVWRDGEGAIGGRLGLLVTRTLRPPGHRRELKVVEGLVPPVRAEEAIEVRPMGSEPRRGASRDGERAAADGERAAADGVLGLFENAPRGGAYAARFLYGPRFLGASTGRRATISAIDQR